MVVLSNLEALRSPSPFKDDFARAAGANAPAGDVDEEQLYDNKDVGEGEEKNEMISTITMNNL